MNDKELKKLSKKQLIFLVKHEQAHAKEERKRAQDWEDLYCRTMYKMQHRQLANVAGDYVVNVEDKKEVERLRPVLLGLTTTRKKDVCLECGVDIFDGGTWGYCTPCGNAVFDTEV